jgi:hypothetical protein
MQEIKTSTAMIARNADVLVFQLQYQAYTTIGGAVALVTMTVPLKPAKAAASYSMSALQKSI